MSSTEWHWDDKPLSVITGDPDKDFKQTTGGSRCSCCGRMQPQVATMYWVVYSARINCPDGYARLAYTASEASHKTVWCKSCILKSKNIKDDFEIPGLR